MADNTMAKQSDENTRQIIQWQNNQTKIQGR
jgi:hypothetical protein